CSTPRGAPGRPAPPARALRRKAAFFQTHGRLIGRPPPGRPPADRHTPAVFNPRPAHRPAATASRRPTPEGGRVSIHGRLIGRPPRDMPRDAVVTDLFQSPAGSSAGRPPRIVPVGRGHARVSIHGRLIGRPPPAAGLPRLQDAAVSIH